MDDRDYQNRYKPSGNQWQGDRSQRKRSRSPYARDDRRRRSNEESPRSKPRSPYSRDDRRRRSNEESPRNKPRGQGGPDSRGHGAFPGPAAAAGGRNYRNPPERSHHQGRPNRQRADIPRALKAERWREVFVGNTGGMPVEALVEFFNTALRPFVVDGKEAVLAAKFDPKDGLFAFVTLVSADLVALALNLDRTVVAQRMLKVNMPTAVQQAPNPHDPSPAGLQKQFEALLGDSRVMSTCVALEGVPGVGGTQEEQEELVAEVTRMCAKHGVVERVSLTHPTKASDESKRVFVFFSDKEAALVCKEAMDGRKLNAAVLRARFVALTEPEHGVSSPQRA